MYTILLFFSLFLSADGETQSVYLNLRDQIAPSLVRLETSGGDEMVDGVNALTEITGLIVTPDGYVFSSAVGFAHHPDAVIAVLPDGQHAKAEIVSTDFVRKITLLKIEPPAGKTFPVPTPAKVEPARVGQQVLAFGRILNPDVPTLTTGILSGKRRQNGVAIQTDAHVSPSNYGGPLVNLDGEVLGILTPFGMGPNELMTGVDLYDSGIGFAIPLEDLLALLPRMKEQKELKPTVKMGLTFDNPSPILAGTKILYVKPDSPAAKAGIKEGDVVTHADGVPVTRGVEVLWQNARHFEGETVKLTLKRGEETIEAELEL